MSYNTGIQSHVPSLFSFWVFIFLDRIMAVTNPEPPPTEAPVPGDKFNAFLYRTTKSYQTSRVDFCFNPDNCFVWCIYWLLEETYSFLIHVPPILAIYGWVDWEACGTSQWPRENLRRHIPIKTQRTECQMRGVKMDYFLFLEKKYLHVKIKMAG